MLKRPIYRFGLCLSAAIAAGMLEGCTVHPPGEREERRAAGTAGKSFEKRFENRSLPPLPEIPTAEDLAQYSLTSNADLEARYWQWRSALEQVPQDGTQATTLNVALGSTITKGRTSNAMTPLTFGNDPMTDIKWPGKLDAAARIALENAKAAGFRFRKAQFDLRNKVLGAYYDYALNAELIRLAEANQQLLQKTVTVSAARSRAGAAGQQDVLKANNEVDFAGNDIAGMKSQLPGQLALLNALLGRRVDAPIALPEHLPEVEPVTLDDAKILAFLKARNAELFALDAEYHGRVDAIRLAKLQYFPDFNLSAGTDLAGITQTLLGQVTIPLFRYEALNAAIAQAEANLHATQAMRRQTISDLATQVVSDVAIIRDADRQLDLFEHTVLPRTRQVVDVGRSSYESGRATLLDLLDAQRTLISVQRLVANLRVVRAKHLADLEAIAAARLGSR